MSRQDGKRRRLRIILLLTALPGGCMPHALHGPRVERGTNWAVSGSVGRQLAAGDRGDSWAPTMYGAVRRGWVSGDGRAALLAGAQLSPLLALYFLENNADDWGEIALATSYLDIYGQPPGTRGTRWDGGGGVQLSSQVVAPYLQFGQHRDIRGAWYTTQMLAIAGGEFNDATYWLPTLGFRDLGRFRTDDAIDLEVTAMVPVAGREDAWFAFFTFTVELGLRDRPR